MPTFEKCGVRAKLPLQGLAAEVEHGSDGQAGTPSGWCLLSAHGVRLRGRLSSTQDPFPVLSDVTHGQGRVARLQPSLQPGPILVFAGPEQRI